MKILIRILGLVALLLSVPLLQAAESKAKSADAKGKAGARIDINTADTEALQALPGVGPATAQAIVAARPFSSVDDLEKVQGIGPVKMAELKPLVRASRSGGKAKAEGKGRGDENKSERAKEKAKSKSSVLRGKIDVNTADAATLEELPGVGPATARAIIAGRPFSSVDDLERVAGIGAARLGELREHATVSRRSADKAASPPSGRGAARADERERDLEPTGRINPGPSPSTAPTTTPPRTSAGGTKAVPRGNPAETSASATGRINLNTASREELEALPEIGPVKAQAIIDARPFKSVEDVMRVKGVKEGTFDAIKDRITVR